MNIELRELRELAAQIAHHLREDDGNQCRHCDDPIDRDFRAIPHRGPSAASVLRRLPDAERSPLPPRYFQESALWRYWAAVRDSLEHNEPAKFSDAACLLFAMLSTPADLLATAHTSQGGDVRRTLETNLREFTLADCPLWPKLPDGEAGVTYVGLDKLTGSAWNATLAAARDSVGELLLTNPETIERMSRRGTTVLQLLRTLPEHDWRPMTWNQPAERIPLHLSRVQPLLRPVEDVGAGHLPLHEQFRAAGRLLLALALLPVAKLTSGEPDAAELLLRFCGEPEAVAG